MMKIAKANKNDHLQKIIKFQIAMALESEGLALEEALVKKGVEKIFNNTQIGFYLVCEQAEDILACLLVQKEWSDWRNGEVLWIHSVYVEPAFRKMGIFRNMYEYLREMVRESPNYLGLRLYVDQGNISAQAVYKKMQMKNDHYLLFEWIKT